MLVASRSAERGAEENLESPLDVFAHDLAIPAANEEICTVKRAADVLAAGPLLLFIALHEIFRRMGPRFVFWYP